LTVDQRVMLAVDFIEQEEAAAKERQKAGKGTDGSGGRGHKKNPGVKSPEGFGRTRSKIADRAKASEHKAQLAIDVKNQILFAACREPQMMVMLKAGDGKILDALPIGSGVDSAIFNPQTKEAYSAQIDGTLSIIKENTPTSFVIEQTLPTKESAKQMVWDSKTNRILLFAADFLPPTGPPRAGVAGYGGKMVPDSFSILVVSK